MPRKLAERPEFRHQMLLEESDRGCVLIGAAALDSALELALRALFSASASIRKKSVDPLLGPNGPLSSYWSKTQLLNSLGMLPESIYRDLERIRRVRNRFAHVYEPVSFTDPEVKDAISSLENTEFFKKGIKRSHISKDKEGRPSDRALAERGFVRFERACFAWCVEEVSGFLNRLRNRLQDLPARTRAPSDLQ